MACPEQSIDQNKISHNDIVFYYVMKSFAKMHNDLKDNSDWWVIRGQVCDKYINIRVYVSTTLKTIDEI